MKKIVSLLLATAVIFCMGITSFASNTAPFKFDGDKEVTLGDSNTDVVLNLSIDLDEATAVSVIAFTFDFGDADGIKVKEVDSTAVASYIPLNAGATDIATGLVTYMKDDASGVDFPAGVITIPVTLTVDNTVAKDYTVTLTSDSMLVDGVGENPINDCETYPTATITVKAAGPSVKTLEAKDVATVNGAKTKADGTTTDEQIGGAAALTVTIPSDVTFENNMIWSLTTADGKLFSKKVDTGLSALSGTVKLAATFVTGSHRTGTDVFTEIKGVNAIFKAVDGDFYFTDAADADAQAK